MDEPDQDRSSFAVAMEWVSRLTSIALEMALPGLGGYGLDRWLGTKVLFLVLGVVIGFILGLWQLILLTKPRKSE